MSDSRFSLRSATGDDTEFLADMLVAAVNWDPARPQASREQVLGDRLTAHYVEGWPRVGDLGALAVDTGGQPIGAVWLRLFSADDPGYGFVAANVPELSLGVVPPWRGRGVGRALLTEITRQAEASGFTRMCLSVERANRAFNLYAGEGFTTVESGPDSDTMIKIISRQ
ncbi:GNAT family N-acetyltransferase [Streptomyces chumphonensis]|uniref:GNAT family N-acetyltransferase n=1 Tax=Streptomyces chumphonensis TaxID=1214925 RepID=A0A927F3J0_9ACTN|nr:GNAT family N-acetyltransferase [Streptomyces chumphonensis]MBD3934893.1 GNAT family N-acetyltransferase [Streptomyces chumphonensis]